jgi:hypothetical protein
MAEIFECLLDSDKNIQYRVRFSGPREVETLEVQIENGPWQSLPPEIAHDLIGFEDAEADSVIHFESVSDKDDAALVASDNARIRKGLVH